MYSPMREEEQTMAMKLAQSYTLVAGLSYSTQSFPHS
jgi:hypothetical protein